jgi:hypothetical protein
MFLCVNKGGAGLPLTCGKIEVKYKVLALALAAALSACGGGGSDGTASGSFDNREACGGDCTPGNENNTGAVQSKEARYAVYKYGVAEQLPGDAGKLGLDADGNPTLKLDGGTVKFTKDPVTGAVSASGFTSYIGRNGSVFMLCDTQPEGWVADSYFSDAKKALYAGVLIGALDGGQATKITRAAELAGQTLYRMKDCFYYDRSGKSENQNSGPTDNTEAITFDAHGNWVGNDDGWTSGSGTSSEMDDALLGNPHSYENSFTLNEFNDYKTSISHLGNWYYTGYRFGTGASAAFALIGRRVGTVSRNGVVYPDVAVHMWITRPQ